MDIVWKGKSTEYCRVNVSDSDEARERLIELLSEDWGQFGENGDTITIENSN